MRALQLVGDGEIRVQDVDIPHIGPKDVLVKVAGAGLCHSDLHVLHGKGWPSLPMTLGHETAGHVAALGDEVTDFAEGDAVLVCVVWACGTCRACVKGRDNACITARGRLRFPPAPGLGPDGGMAEYIRAEARYLEPLGSLEPATAGPLADAGLTPYHAIDGARHQLAADSTAVILGVGGLGHVGLQILKAVTAARVVAVDSSEQKLDVALEHGADQVLLSDERAAGAILEMTGGAGADAVFDFVGVQATVTLATEVIAPDGALRFVGLGGGSFTYTADARTNPLPWGVEVRRSYGGTRRDQRAVIDLAQAGKLTVDVQHYPLEEGLRAFDDLEKGLVRGRAVLVP